MRARPLKHQFYVSTASSIRSAARAGGGRFQEAANLDDLQDRVVLHQIDRETDPFEQEMGLQAGDIRPIALPTAPGYSIEMLPASIELYEFPRGSVWSAGQPQTIAD